MDQQPPENKGIPVVEILMEWIAPPLGAIAVGLLVFRTGAPFWLVMICMLLGAFAGQIAMIGLLSLIGFIVKSFERRRRG